MATSQLSRTIQIFRRAALSPGGAGLTDGQLLDRFIECRDEVAFAALVRQHGQVIWGVCRRILSHHDAEDAFQATFLVLARKAASVRQRETVVNWLYGVAYRTARAVRRANARRGTKEKQVMDMTQPPAPHEEIWLELLPLLDQELSRLPDKFRLPVIFCDLEGKTGKEAARQMKIPEGTLASRLRTGRMMLTKRLAGHGLMLSGGSLAVMLSQNAASASAPAEVVSSTIKAAPLFAAGQAGATYIVSAKVAALTEGMVKGMLMSKLKIATAVLFMASLVAFTCPLLAGQQKPELPFQVEVKPRVNPLEPSKEDKDKLQGTWRLVTSEIDGVRIGEGRPEIKDSYIVFKKSSVTMVGKLIHSPEIKKEPEDVKAVGTFTLDTKKNPNVIVLTWETNPWLGKEYSSQRSIYTLEGDNLIFCMYLPGEDTRLLVPTEFSANSGSKRCVSTFKREPPSVKGDGPKQTPPKKLVGSEGMKLVAKEEENLQGTWQMVTAEMDGLRIGVGRPELKDNRLVIENSSFTLFHILLEHAKPEIAKMVADFKLDTTQTPKVIVLTWKEHPNEKKDCKQKAIYTLEGDTLKLCLYLGDVEDKKPLTEFIANAGSKRALWTFKREVESETGGKNKR